MPSARTWRRAAVVGGLGLAGVYAFEAAQYHRTAGKGFELENPPAPGTPDFARMVEALTVAPLRQGNRVTVLRNGCEIFPSMLEAIRSAERSINFATYVYWTGSIAPEFAEALAERAEAGVEVNVLLDAVGAAKMDRTLIDRLTDAGAKVAWFRPPKWYTLHKLNNRTHRKILVVDGRVGFTGGVGIAEEWTGNCEDPGHWRDTHVRVEGPAARDLLGGFLDNW
ncbi:MAG TPA: phospholipase D-like domain-containing protein, partial [Actinomycetes bacterium]